MTRELQRGPIGRGDILTKSILTDTDTDADTFDRESIKIPTVGVSGDEENDNFAFDNSFSRTSVSIDEEANSSIIITGLSNINSSAKESRDEDLLDNTNERADDITERLGIQRDNRDDDFKAVISILDKNISSANAHHHSPDNPNGNGCCVSHGITENRKNYFSGKVIEDSFNHFLSLHNCQPLLDADEDDSISYHPKLSNHKDDDSVSLHQKAIDEKESHGQQSIMEGYIEDEEEAKKKIYSLRRELDASRQVVSNLENQISRNIQSFSTSQAAAMVNQRREFETLSAGKQVAEARLQTAEKQLAEAKNETNEMKTKLDQMGAEINKLKEKLLETTRERDKLQEGMIEIELTEKSRNDRFDSTEEEKSRLENSVHQLRLDLNEARSSLRRVEKERKRERKHYQRLVEVASNDKSNMERRVEKEVESSLETRRKFFVLEEQLAAKKEREADLLSQLSNANKQLQERDYQCLEFMTMVEETNKRLKEKEKSNRELRRELDEVYGKLKSEVDDNEDQGEALNFLREKVEKTKKDLALKKKENGQLKEEVTRLQKANENERSLKSEKLKLEQEKNERLRGEITRLQKVNEREMNLVSEKLEFEKEKNDKLEEELLTLEKESEVELELKSEENEQLKEEIKCLRKANEKFLKKHDQLKNEVMNTLEFESEGKEHFREEVKRLYKVNQKFLKNGEQLRDEAKQLKRANEQAVVEDELKLRLEENEKLKEEVRRLQSINGSIEQEDEFKSTSSDIVDVLQGDEEKQTRMSRLDLLHNREERELYKAKGRFDHLHSEFKKTSLLGAAREDNRAFKKKIEHEKEQFELKQKQRLNRLKKSSLGDSNLEQDSVFDYIGSVSLPSEEDELKRDNVLDSTIAGAVQKTRPKYLDTTRLNDASPKSSKSVTFDKTVDTDASASTSQSRTEVSARVKQLRAKYERNKISYPN